MSPLIWLHLEKKVLENEVLQIIYVLFIMKKLRINEKYIFEIKAYTYNVSVNKNK